MNAVVEYAVANYSWGVRWCIGRRVPADDAEDVVQETIERVWKLSPDVAKPGGYWWAALKNQIKQYWRQQRAVCSLDDAIEKPCSRSLEDEVIARDELRGVAALIRSRFVSGHGREVAVRAVQAVVAGERVDVAGRTSLHRLRKAREAATCG